MSEEIKSKIVVVTGASSGLGEARRVAAGAYTAFLDLVQSLAGPALGSIAAGARLNVPFGTATVRCVSLVARGLIANPTTIEGDPR